MLDKLRELVQKASHAIAFTGAGISTESGLSDYRSQRGIWKSHDPFKVATAKVLERDPERFFEFYRSRLAHMGDVEPNQGHRALAHLEEIGKLRCIITQNVDSLHQKAGTRNVIEVHGSLARAYCIACDHEMTGALLHEMLATSDGVPRCDCGGIIRPGVVLFGEALPEREVMAAYEQAFASDLVLVIGSSLTVWPAAGIPTRAIGHGARLAVINEEPTPLDDKAVVVIHQRCGEVLSRLADGM